MTPPVEMRNSSQNLIDCEEAHSSGGKRSYVRPLSYVDSGSLASLCLQIGSFAISLAVLVLVSVLLAQSMKNDCENSVPMRQLVPSMHNKSVEARSDVNDANRHLMCALPNSKVDVYQKDDAHWQPEVKDETTEALLCLKNLLAMAKMQTGSCYSLSDERLYSTHNVSLNWTAAQAYCRRFNGYLLTINSAEKAAYIDELATRCGMRNYWIGLTSRQTKPAANCDGPWQWSDNTTAEYKHWMSEKPSGCSSGENCAQVRDDQGQSGWKVSPCSAEIPFICEAH